MEGRGGSDERYQGSEWKWPPWKHLPQRYKLIGTTSLAFVICNMDKVRYVTLDSILFSLFRWVDLATEEPEEQFYLAAF